MSKVTALSLSIAVLGGIWAFLALGPMQTPNTDEYSLGDRAPW